MSKKVSGYIAKHAGMPLPAAVHTFMNDKKFWKFSHDEKVLVLMIILRDLCNSPLPAPEKPPEPEILTPEATIAP